MNIASVPCRCGQSCTAPVEVADAASSASGHQRAARPRVVRRPGRPAPPDHVGRLGDHRRAGRVEHHPTRAAPSRARSRAARAAAAPASRGPPARRRQRLSGRRRSAPRPEHGASTSTRSKVPSEPGGPRPVTGDHVAPGGPQRLGHQPRAVRLPLVGEQPGSALRASAASRAALPPGPAHRSSQRSSRPSTSARASASATSWDPASCTPARPSRTAGIAPGSPDSSATPSGETRRCAGRRRSSSTVDNPGRATSVTRGRSLSAASNALELVGPGERPAELLDDPRGVGGPDRPSDASSRSIHASRSRSAIRRISALVKPAGLWPTRSRTSSTVLVDGGVVGHAHGQHLVGAEAERVADGGVGSPTGEMVDDGVVRPLAAERPADQLGGERGVAALDPALAQELRQHQVGVGVVLADRPQHVVRRQPGRSMRPVFRLAGPLTRGTP